jgi:high-affinity Fe2+/Pb2+ permease
MKRRFPNPWVLIPVLLGAAIGGVIGWSVTTVSCRPDSCVTGAVLVGIGSALVTAIGVLVVAVLVLRSLNEWQQAVRKGEEPPGPGCEVPQPDPK